MKTKNGSLLGSSRSTWRLDYKYKKYNPDGTFNMNPSKLYELAQIPSLDASSGLDAVMEH